MDQPKASSSKWAAARALHLKMQKYHPLRWLHGSGVVRQETGERARFLLEMQRQNRKKHKRRIAGNKIVYRDKTHCGMDSRGNTNRGDGSEVVQCPCKGGRQLEPYGSSGRKHNLGDGKPRITIVRRSCEDGDQWNRWWGVRIEPKNTTEKRTQDTTQNITQSTTQ